MPRYKTIPLERIASNIKFFNEEYASLSTVSDDDKRDAYEDFKEACNYVLYNLQELKKGADDFYWIHPTNMLAIAIFKLLAKLHARSPEYMTLDPDGPFNKIPAFSDHDFLKYLDSEDKKALWSAPEDDTQPFSVKEEHLKAFTDAKIWWDPESEACIKKLKEEKKDASLQGVCFFDGFLYQIVHNIKDLDIKAEMKRKTNERLADAFVSMKQRKRSNDSQISATSEASTASTVDRE